VFVSVLEREMKRERIIESEGES
jgi:hypothetical protein